MLCILSWTISEYVLLFAIFILPHKVHKSKRMLLSWMIDILSILAASIKNNVWAVPPEVYLILLIK